jgi:hypothetical protein
MYVVIHLVMVAHEGCSDTFVMVDVSYLMILDYTSLSIVYW